MQYIAAHQQDLVTRYSGAIIGDCLHNSKGGVIAMAVAVFALPAMVCAHRMLALWYMHLENMPVVMQCQSALQQDHV